VPASHKSREALRQDDHDHDHAHDPDELYFLRFRHRWHRLRRAYPGEWAELLEACGGVSPFRMPKCDSHRFTLHVLTKLDDGHVVRIGMMLPRDFDTDAMSESDCKTLFDRLFELEG
jgi:hypothetical protein